MCRVQLLKLVMFRELSPIKGHWSLSLWQWAWQTRFKNTYQSGFLSILYSIGSKPLQIWDKKVGEMMANCLEELNGEHGSLVVPFWSFLEKLGTTLWLKTRKHDGCQVRNGHIKRLTDSDIQSSVLAPWTGIGVLVNCRLASYLSWTTSQHIWICKHGAACRRVQLISVV